MDGYTPDKEDYEEYLTQNEVYKFIKEPAELSVPIINIKITPPQQEPLDSIIKRALNRIDPYIEYIIRERIKLYPKALNKKQTGT